MFYFPGTKDRGSQTEFDIRVQWRFALYFENFLYITNEGIRCYLKHRKAKTLEGIELSVDFSPCLWVKILSAEHLGSSALFRWGAPVA